MGVGNLGENVHRGGMRAERSKAEGRARAAPNRGDGGARCGSNVHGNGVSRDDGVGEAQSGRGVGEVRRASSDGGDVGVSTSELFSSTSLGLAAHQNRFAAVLDGSLNRRFDYGVGQVLSRVG